MIDRSYPIVSSTLALALLCSCHTTSRPLLESEGSVPPTLAKKADLLLFECTFFSAPDDFDLLKNTKANHVAGVFSEEDGDRLIRKLKGKRNFELMSAPKITTRQRQKAKVEIIRELIYPTEFKPPVVDKKSTEFRVGSYPVTPATPSQFDTKNVGITAAFSGRSTSTGGIDFTFDIEQVNLLGFVNYGSPITTAGETSRGKPIEIVLTENRIEQPVFATKRMASTVTLSNGHYTAIGGLRNDEQNSLETRTRPDKLGKSPGLVADKNLFALIKVSAIQP